MGTAVTVLTIMAVVLAIYLVIAAVFSEDDFI